MIAAEAPSNIALVKYMGKIKGAERNKPTNPSFSLTLNHLRSRVEITAAEGPYDLWATFESLDGSEWIPTQLSEKGRARYLAHFGFLKQKLGISGAYLVRSANNFPSDCGIASSASSFAALTMASYSLAKTQNPKLDLTLQQISELSRIGSGSSIRSFFSPLVVWDESGAHSWETPLKFRHQVAIVDRTKKAIGSSDAHERVPSSLLFQGRPERASQRLQQLQQAFNGRQWRTAYEICWAEFWDMHALFATSQPSFFYMTPASLQVLDYIHNYWEKNQDGPLVTMDAGANVHLIYRADQTASADELQLKLTGLSQIQVISGGII